MRRLLPLALAALLAIVLLPGIAAIDATDWREARDAVVVREAAARNDWTLPTYAGKLFLEKPMPGYAPEWLAQQLLHRMAPEMPPVQTQVAVSRAVRAALAALLALLVALVGSRAFGVRAGWLAGCGLASSAGLLLTARTDGAQVLATFCAWLGVAAMLEVLQGRARRPEAVRFAAWLAFGAAALVGGPLSALWPLGGFALYAALARAHTGWRELRPLPGLVLAVIVASAWYVIAARTGGAAFRRGVAWFPYAGEPRGPWFAGILAAFSYPIVLGFPWVPLLAASLRDSARRLRLGGAGPDLRESGHAASLVLAMLVAASVPIALYPHPPLTAALPALPALTLLCGRFLDRVLDGDVERRVLGEATRYAAAVGTLLALLVAALGARLPEVGPGLRLLAGTLFLTAWAPLVADLTGHPKVAASLFALPVALGGPLVSTRVLPALEPWLNAAVVAEAMEAAAPPGAPLVVWDPAPPSLRLLLPRRIVATRHPAGLLTGLAGRDREIYIAFRPAHETDVARTAGGALQVLQRSPVMVLARIAAPGDSTRAAAAGR